MKMKIKKRTLKDIYIVFFLFVLIFAPPILPKTNLILAVFSFGMLLFQFGKSYSHVLYKSGALQWIITMIIFIAYALLIILLNSLIFGDMVQMGHYTALFNRFLVLTVTLISCCTYFICYTEKNDFNTNNYIQWVITAGLIQALFIYASFFSDGIHDLFLFFLRLFGDSSLYENNWYITIRSYGFAGTLVDTFGLGMGLIAGISLLYGVFNEKKYVIYSIVIAVAGIIDTRTTMIIYAISIIVALIYFIFNGKIKLILKWGMWISAGSIIIINAFPVLKRVNVDTYNWINAGIKSIEQLLKGEETSDSLGILFDDQFWQLPDAFQMLFGSGHSLYAAKGYAHSDVGYINDLWFVGLLGMVFLYGSIAILLIKCYRVAKDVVLRLCIIFFGIALLVFNIKGSAIGYNPGTATIFCTIFWGIYFNRRKSNG